MLYYVAEANENGRKRKKKITRSAVRPENEHVT